MKNSIKTLTLLLVAILFSNVSYGVVYKLNNTSWTNSANSSTTAPVQSSLGSGDTVVISGNGTWTLTRAVTSNVRLSGGTLAQSTNTLTGRVMVKGANSTITGTGSINGALRVYDNTLTFGSNKTITSLSMDGGNVNLSAYVVTSTSDFNLNSSGTISGTAGSGIFYTGTNNETNINAGILTIDNAEFIGDKLDFASNGKIKTVNSGLFSFENTNNQITGASGSNFVDGTIRVYVKNSAKNPTFQTIYPLGEGSVYAPISVALTGNSITNAGLSSVSGNYGTHYIDFKYTGAMNGFYAIDNSLVSVSGKEYWTLTSSNTNPAAKLQFTTNSTSTLNYGLTVVQGTNANILTDLHLANYNLSTNQWTKVLATTSSVSGTSSYIVETATYIGPNSYFTFGLTNSRTTFLTPLPVSLIDFSAKVNTNNIEVKWSTASEKDNASFVLEKSIEGLVWSSIATVMGAKNSNVVNNYGVVDYKAVAGFQYYRLKQIDLDGTVTYSKAIAVNFSKASTLNVNLFPNPSKDALNITTDNNATGEVNIQILNSMGETVYNKVVEAGLVQSIDIASFIPGVYYVSIIAEGESKIIRLLKN